jgi:TfoX/Sxy family transcriptional regulator of competence genes
MAFDEGLAERIRECLQDRHDVVEKKMFGGLCFMVSDHMCCGIVGDTLMARVGPANYDACLAKPFASEMDFTGKAMKGMIYVAPEGLDEDSNLTQWLSYCTAFVEGLPPKVKKK